MITLVSENEKVAADKLFQHYLIHFESLELPISIFIYQSPRNLIMSLKLIEDNFLRNKMFRAVQMMPCDVYGCTEYNLNQSIREKKRKSFHFARIFDLRFLF